MRNFDPTRHLTSPEAIKCLRVENPCDNEA